MVTLILPRRLRRTILAAIATFAVSASATDDPPPTPNFSGHGKTYPQSDGALPHPESCKPTGKLAATLQLAGTKSDLRALLVHIRYPRLKVEIPGSADDAHVAARIKPSNGTATITANDRSNGDLKIQAIDPFKALGYPPLTIEFDICNKTKVADGDFECSVEFASDKTAAVLKDVTCSVAVPKERRARKR